MSDMTFSNICWALFLLGGFALLWSRICYTSVKNFPLDQEFYDKDEWEEEPEGYSYSNSRDVDPNEEDDKLIDMYLCNSVSCHCDLL